LTFYKLLVQAYKAVYKDHNFYFDEDTETRDIYRITLKNKKHRFSFDFGQSIVNSNYGNNPPSEYDVLAGLQKYEVGTFDNFCSAVSGMIQTRSKAYKTYKAVMREWKNVEKLFTPGELEQLQEIQ
jgi:hypothetical protein